MESSGKKNRIQCSSSTANLLVAAGKEHWVTRRSDSVNVKGKGVLGCFWIQVKTKAGGSSVGSGSGLDMSRANLSAEMSGFDLAPSINLAKQDRLIGWTTDLFVRRIEAIVARQDPERVGKCPPRHLVYRVPKGKTSLDEVAEVIKMPKFDAQAAARAKARGQVTIPQVVIAQLHEIVSALADMYQVNPFHSFEHAAHVTMATDKFMNRIVTPDIDETVQHGKDHAKLASTVHDYTHGINSDPITLLAIIFSALVHDGKVTFASPRGDKLELANHSACFLCLSHSRSPWCVQHAVGQRG